MVDTEESRDRSGTGLTDALQQGWSGIFAGLLIYT